MVARNLHALALSLQQYSVKADYALAVTGKI